jgi:hypothetical protein
LRSLFDFQLVEGNIYLISNLSVKYNLGSKLASLHNNLLEFNFRTVVKLFWAYGMPPPGESFVGSIDVLKVDQGPKYMLGELNIHFCERNITFMNFWNSKNN